MTHALGAVPDCLRQLDRRRCVTAPRDMLFVGPNRDRQHLVLDHHHDDYSKTLSRSCYDIARDAAWVK